MIETENLLVRQFQEADSAALYDLFGDPDVMRFGAGTQTIEWVDAWLP